MLMRRITETELTPAIKRWIAYRGLDPDSFHCEDVDVYWGGEDHRQLRACTAGIEVALLDYGLMSRIDPPWHDRCVADEIVYGAMIELKRLLIGKRQRLLS